jgi:hypothetical protein
VTGIVLFAFLNYLDVHYEYGGPRGYPKPGVDKGRPIDEYDAGWCTRMTTSDACCGTERMGAGGKYHCHHLLQIMVNLLGTTA